MVRRMALLISSGNLNVAGYEDLPGTAMDVENWKAYLMSPLGGEWIDRDEIQRFYEPDLETIRAFLRAYKDDYVLVLFSGHGGEDPIGRGGACERIVCLNRNELAVPAQEICPINFGTAIFDCCRTTDEDTVSMEKLGFANDRMIALNESRSNNFTQLRNRNLRNVFQMALETDPTGIVQMCACSSNETAMERHDRGMNGGVYSTLLINGARRWNRTSSAEPVYYTDDAHAFAERMIPRYASGQHPEYIPQDCRHPFAVK